MNSEDNNNATPQANAPIDPIRALATAPDTLRYLARQEEQRKAERAAGLGPWTATSCEIYPRATGYEKFRQALTVMVENTATGERYPFETVGTQFLPGKPLNALLPIARSVTAKGDTRDAALRAWGRAVDRLTGTEAGVSGAEVSIRRAGYIIQENPPPPPEKPKRTRKAKAEPDDDQAGDLDEDDSDDGSK